MCQLWQQRHLQVGALRPLPVVSDWTKAGLGTAASLPSVRQDLR